MPLTGTIGEEIYDNISTNSERLALQIDKDEEKDQYAVTFKLKSGDQRSANLFEYQLTFNPGKIKRFPKSYFLDKYRERETTGSYSLMSKVLNDLHWRLKKKDLTFEKENQSISDKLSEAVDQQKRVIKTINKVVEDLSSDNHEFEFNFINRDYPFNSAFLVKDINGKAITPNLMGSGFNIVLAYALLQYVVNLEKIPIILLIDEPEMHLHSDWQKKLYDKFCELNNIQTIYATQSESFISLKNWRQIKTVIEGELIPTPDTLYQEIGDSQATLEAYLDDYARKNLHISLFLRDNLELLFTEKCVIVEGPAEKYSLPRLLELMDCDISKHSISIIPAWGKGKIKQYQVVCKCFRADYFTLFDQDGKEDSSDNNKENQFIEINAINNLLHKFSTSFEALLGVKDFQGVVGFIDNVSSLDQVHKEIYEALVKIKKYIES